MKELSGLLAKHYKRRGKAVLKKLKNGIALKDKEDRVVFCKLTDVQLRAYKRVIGSPDYQLLLRSKEQCDCNRSSGLPRGRCCHQTPHQLVTSLGVPAVSGRAKDAWGA